MDSKLRCVFVVEDGHAESGNFEGANNEYSTAKSDLPVKTTALSSSPKVKLSLTELTLSSLHQQRFSNRKILDSNIF